MRKVSRTTHFLCLIFTPGQQPEERRPSSLCHRRVPARQESGQAEAEDYEGYSNDGTDDLDPRRDGARLDEDRISATDLVL